ncbi:hypothetical protein GGI25_006041 [Coemansia spiralis]|uniref:Uncharacterized protein n=2 Tax=Coemansia TaxID=4863 RepID=A0A9W8G3F5_9FUNG|nr:hypothetical protein EDC05_006083 [Coemansia umbellata]KAJ2618918.1 hypothetical protein GGI26_006234 [Coemansia sp. RSA 1358]KAJ2669831.1 hypothetical protein GGI25_006041 [Coemansia spiralis]
MTVPELCTGIATECELPEELLNQKSAKFVGVVRDISWNELKLLVAANRFDLLGRKSPDELEYQADLRRIREEYGSVAAFVRQVKLAEFLADPSTRYLMIPNDYPYALQGRTTHYIIWSKAKLTHSSVPDAKVRELFESKLDAQLGAGKYEWVWFVNPPQLQSIPEVFHGHLLVRELDD